MDKILENNFKFTANFFTSAISKNKLFHSYLLTGNDNVAKYAFALNVARILNCQGDKTESCQCLNCKWIRNNSHPAVMTFSPLDFIHVNESGKARENLTVAQARFIKNELTKTSTYHRVLIITNATEGNEVKNEYDLLKQYSINPPLEAGKENSSDRIWAPKSLKKEIFTTETANTLLKTIEEPFENVTFFFLANSQEDLIETIVSRCQIVNIPSANKTYDDFSILEKLISNIPAKEDLVALHLSEHVKNLAKEHGMTILEILELLENYYHQNRIKYLNSQLNYREALIFLNKIEKAKTQLKRYVNVDSVLENLFLR